MKTTAKDLTGQRFGRLVAQFPAEQKDRSYIMWECQCDCGNRTIVRSSHLIDGQTKSCGCLVKETWSKIGKKATKNIENKRFGRLVALYPTDMRTKDGKIYWNCRCDCGKEVLVNTSDLLRGGSKSCGCYKIDRLTTHGMSKTKEYLNAASRKRRELEQLYDSEYGAELEIALKEFFPACVICGITREEHIEKYGKNLHNDHVIPLSKGHGLIPGNAVVLCQEHNERKHAKPLKRLPQEWQNKILKASKEFEEYWYATN